MLSFKNWVNNQYLEEKMITFGGRIYPKFGNVVIMAGGAGSGKGFILKNLLGIEGKVMDVDHLKVLASKSPKIIERVKEKFGKNLKDLSLRNPENVSFIHDIIYNYLNLDDRVFMALASSIISSPSDRKPNLIFDVTLRSLSHLEEISEKAALLGYDKKNIHIVWVVNDIEVAKQQNLSRSRIVPTEILVNTHAGASRTMNDIASMGDKLSKYMDGDIVFAFNKVDVDTSLAVSGRGGKYIKDAEYVYIKKQGKAPLTPDKLDNRIRNKIRSYVPKEIQW